MTNLKEKSFVAATAIFTFYVIQQTCRIQFFWISWIAKSRSKDRLFDFLLIGLMWSST